MAAVPFSLPGEGDGLWGMGGFVDKKRFDPFSFLKVSILLL